MEFVLADKSAFPSPYFKGSADRSLMKLLMILGFLIAYIVAFGISYKPTDTLPTTTFILLGGITGLLCIITFVYAGSGRILAASAISYGHLLFVALPVVTVGIGDYPLRSDLNPVRVVQLLTLFFVVQLILFSSATATVGRRASIEIRGGYQLLAMAAAGAMASVDLFLSDTYLNSITGGFWIASVVLSSLVAFTRTTLKSSFAHCICLALILGTYGLVGFSGYGRLTLASYMISVAVVFSWVFKSYLPKLITLAVTPLALVIMRGSRQALISEQEGRAASDVYGLGSVMGPFQSGSYVFQEIIAGTISPHRGESHFVSLLFWIPRQFWESKPEGFGRAIVPYTSPGLYRTNHSDAASYIVEYFWDFGLIGIVLVALFPFAMGRLDSRINSILENSNISGARVLIFIASAIAVSMLLNYVWGGSFTYTSRTLIPVVVILFGAVRVSKLDTIEGSGVLNASAQAAAISDKLDLRNR